MVRGKRPTKHTRTNKPLTITCKRGGVKCAISAQAVWSTARIAVGACCNAFSKCASLTVQALIRQTSLCLFSARQPHGPQCAGSCHLEGLRCPPCAIDSDQSSLCTQSGHGKCPKADRDEMAGLGDIVTGSKHVLVRLATESYVLPWTTCTVRNASLWCLAVYCSFPYNRSRRAGGVWGGT